MEKKYNIGVIGGDGIGPEIIKEGVKVLKSVSEVLNFKLEFIEYDFGGERYLKTGETLPDSAIEEFKKLDAIYLGAVGHPDVPPGILEKGILLKIRFELDQYINLRPVKLYPGVWTPLKDKKPEDIDYVVVRENTEGLYCGIGGNFKKGTSDEIATQLSINTRKGIERCIKYAFKLAKERN
ncbi:MAG: isocitrate/isopropylmalate family dehydrogenase, partial [bacterium]|nr:isocitrate/isopropylmalate family dehydrogenase [bacterium]MDW8164375.1 isocitrate/isopropylmalate family dehydrogenase [Candidatus Omnitrophota bacterium]